MTDLQTFTLPQSVGATDADVALARAIIAAWRRDGILQIRRDAELDEKTEAAFDASRRFFSLPFERKARCVSDLSYSGYIASGEEITAGENDYSEIFTVTPDFPLHDWRVQAQWPCHGPAPWPDENYRDRMQAFMHGLGQIGEKLLRLTALGLGLADIDALTRLTRDGWHHMRVLRFPTVSSKSARGIGAHTDYGLLVIAAQDDVGGLYIRPPVAGEKRNRNWLPNESMAGMYENDEPWTFVKPVPNVVTVFPGDILQFLTGGYLLSTPHKVRLNTRERHALAYFHEPNFEATVRPLRDPTGSEHIHYGTHFTNMFMRSYPERVTTRRIVEEDRLRRFLHRAEADVGAARAARA
jgi:isopenicillin N synthase-like dioxygenase